MNQRTFASTGCPSGRRLASRLTLLLCAFALLGCAVNTANVFAPNQVAVASKSDVVVFGKIEYLEEGKDAQPPGLLLYIIPSKYTGTRFGTGEIRISYNYNQPFYVVLPSNDYVVTSADGVRCSHVGFRIPEGADAVYIGTLSVDVYLRLWGSYVVKTSVKDEFRSAVKLFKIRNPMFSANIVKSLIVFDKDIPEWDSFHRGNKLGCRKQRRDLRRELWFPPLQDPIPLLF